MSAPSLFVRPEATTWSVEDILRRAREGQLFIPAFQRSFRWEANDVRKLFDSIYRGYPIGDLLLWETERTEGTTTTFGPVTVPPNKGRGFVIIDGQQRVTSLVAALLRNEVHGPQDSRFHLLFDLEKGSFLQATRARDTWPESWLPLPEVSDTVRFLEWLQARKLSEDHVRSANYLVRSLRDYRVPVYVVHTSDEEQIREIFERLNTTGKRLDAAEIFNALQRGRQGTDLQSMAKGLKELGLGELNEEWLLKSVAAVLGIDVTKNLGEALRSISKDKVHQGLVDTERAIRNVIYFLRQDVGISHVELLPYRFPLVALTKLFHLIPDPSSQARRQLATWVWKGAWSTQHSRSDATSIRAVLDSVTEDEEATVKKLLATIPHFDESFKLRKHDFRAAGTKLTCAVLASRGPRHLETGDMIDVSRIIDEHGADAFQPIIRRVMEGTSGTQNRLLHESSEFSLREAIIDGSDDVLASHYITAEAREALKEGNDNIFLALRREALQQAVNDFLAVRTSVPALVVVQPNT